MENSENLLTSDLQIDPIAQNHLKEAASWAKFLGIVGFVGSGIIVIIAIFAGSFLARLSYSPYSRGYNGGFGGMIMIFYLIAAGLGFMVSLYTYRFGIKTKQALQTSDQDTINNGFMNLKFVFRFYGVIAVIYIGLIAIGFFLGIMGLMMRG